MAELSPNSVRTYHLAPEGYIGARKKLLGQRAILLVGIVIFASVFIFHQADFKWRSGSLASLAPYFILIAVLAGALGSGIIKGMKKNREAWDTFELVIGEDFLIRRIKGFPELEIRREEVTSIKESPVGLHVETGTSDRTIGIASALVDYDDAKARLSQWMAPVRLEQPGWLKPARWMPAVPLLILLLFGLFLLSARSWVLVATGTPLLVFLLWSFMLIRESVQVSDRVKRMSLLIFLPLLSIAAKLILAIIHWQ